MFYVTLILFFLNGFFAYKNFNEGNHKTSLFSMFATGWMFGLLVRDIVEALVMNGTI